MIYSVCGTKSTPHSRYCMYLDLEFRLPSGSRPPFCSRRIITWCSRTSHLTSLLGISPTPQTINTTQVITYPSGQSYSYIGARCSVMPRYVLVPLVASSFEGFRPSGACRDLPGKGSASTDGPALTSRNKTTIDEPYCFVEETLFHRSYNIGRNIIVLRSWPALRTGGHHRMSHGVPVTTEGCSGETEDPKP